MSVDTGEGLTEKNKDTFVQAIDGNGATVISRVARKWWMRSIEYTSLTIGKTLFWQSYMAIINIARFECCSCTS